MADTILTSETDTLNPLLELAERVEAATGPDREIDCEVAVAAMGFFVAEPRYEGEPTAYGYVDKDGTRVYPGHGGKQLIPAFTSSVDAAMTLIPEGWWLHRLVELDGRTRSHAELTNGRTFYGRGGKSNALALTAACLKARATSTP